MGHDETQMSVLIRFFSRFLSKIKNRTDRLELPEAIDSREPPKTVPTYEKLKNRGTELLDSGDRQEAILFFEAAFNERPNAESHVNLGFALLEIDRSSDAKIHFEQAVKLNPNSFDANFLYACVACADGDYKAASASVKSALIIDPHSEPALNLFYKVLAIEGDFTQIEDHLTLNNSKIRSISGLKVLMARTLLDISAESDLKQSLLVHAANYLKIAIELNPNDPDVFIEQGRLFLFQDHAALAADSFVRAVTLSTNFAPAYYGLAKAQKILGNRTEAAASAEKAILKNPQHIDAHKMLADISLEKSEYVKAENHYQIIINLDPNSAEAKILLGVVYSERGQYQLATDVTRQAIDLSKGFPEGYFALGNIFLKQQRYTDAVDCYHQALKLRPDYVDVKNNLASSLLAMGNNDEALRLYQGIVQVDPTNEMALQNVAYSLSFNANCTPAEYLAAARQFGTIATARAKPFTTWVQKPLAGRALKVGLVSGDFRRHPVGFFLESVLTYFDPEKTEIHAFSNLVYTDDLQASLKSRVSHWTSISSLTDEEAATLIHDAELDLLIDLSGHTGANRCALFSWRAAPVQAAWLGYWASTGVAEIDYILTDRHSVLPEHQSHFSEKVWYLASTRMCFTPKSLVYELLPSPCPSIKLGYITFGCFQAAHKLNHEVLALWSQIHRQLPNARFYLQGKGFDDLTIRAELLARLKDAGLPLESVSLHGGEKHLAFLKTHRKVDIILDTFPFPGGTTTCEALWMGVPTVTLAGNSMLARQGVSLLNYAGLSDWVARTGMEYVAIAVQKAGNIQQLSLLRAALRQQVFQSSLFQAPDFSMHLEDTFRDIVLDKYPQLKNNQYQL